MQAAQAVRHAAAWAQRSLAASPWWVLAPAVRTHASARAQGARARTCAARVCDHERQRRKGRQHELDAPGHVQHVVRKPQEKHETDGCEGGVVIHQPAHARRGRGAPRGWCGWAAGCVPPRGLPRPRPQRTTRPRPRAAAPPTPRSTWRRWSTSAPPPRRHKSGAVGRAPCTPAGGGGRGAAWSASPALGAGDDSACTRAPGTRHQTRGPVTRGFSSPPPCCPASVVRAAACQPGGSWRPPARARARVHPPSRPAPRPTLTHTFLFMSMPPSPARSVRSLTTGMSRRVAA